MVIRAPRTAQSTFSRFLKAKRFVFSSNSTEKNENDSTIGPNEEDESAEIVGGSPGIANDGTNKDQSPRSPEVRFYLLSRV